MTALPWETVLRDFAAHMHLTAAEVLDGYTWAEFYGLWFGGGTVRKPHDPNAVRDKINRLRAEKGLPPMKPAPQKG